jgi:hypothetical protein
MIKVDKNGMHPRRIDTAYWSLDSGENGKNQIIVQHRAFKIKHHII